MAIQWQFLDPSATAPHFEVAFISSTDGAAAFGSKTSVTGNRFPTSDSTLNDIAISGAAICILLGQFFKTIALMYTLQEAL